MTFVLIEKRRILKGFLALLLVFSVRLPAQDLAARNFFKATLADALDLGVAPARLSKSDWAMLSLPVAGLFALAQSDTLLYPRLRGRQDWLESTMPVATAFGEGLYAAGGSALLWGLGGVLASPRLSGASARALEAMAFCAIGSGTLKYAFNANRPTDRDDRHDFFTAGISGSPSFPSGHSMVAFALAEVYGKTYGRYWSYPLAAVVAYSRIYLGVHWPSDVLAGALVGAGLGYAVNSDSEGKGSPDSLKFSLLPAANGSLLASASLNY